MRIAIAGGGITGCLTALYARTLGAEVTVYESSAELGGVLRDIDIDGQKFFNGCQYLEDGLEDALIPALYSQLYRFSHEYGSYTRLQEDIPRIIDDCAQPALGGHATLELAATIHGTAAERLRAYGSPGAQIRQWASGFGQLESLDWRCLVPMQLSRVYFPDDAEALQSKAADPVADQLLAIPRRKRCPGAEVESALLPAAGFSAFFAIMDQLMRSSGIEVQLNAPLKIRMEGDSPKLYVRQSIQRYDKLVWASNPVPLLDAVTGVRLQTPGVPMQLVMGYFEAAPWSKPYYWQIFDKESPVVRIYLYQLGGRACFSVEAFDRPVDDWASALAPLFDQLGLGWTFHISSTERQKRHVNFSREEYALIESLSPRLAARDIIPGGWNRYGRKQKMAVIRSHLDELAR